MAKLNINILFVTTMYRCGEKVYPIIPHLASSYKLDILLYSQMSPESEWTNENDVRIPLYKYWKSICNKVISGPGWFQVRDFFHSKKIDKILKCVSNNKYDLVIYDDNFVFKKKGLGFLSEYFRDKKTIIMACPHGNKDFKGHMGAQGIGRTHDYCFVFGEKEKRKVKQKKKEFLLPAGIPSNDALVKYNRTNEYILFIPNFLADSSGNRRAKKIGFKICNEQTFIKSGVLDLARSSGCCVLVKEKSRLYNYAENNNMRKYLKQHNVKFVRDVEDDNDLISRSRYVISAPSTLAFKSIQIGIPTAILKGYGLIGNFCDFCGLVPCDKKEVISTIKRQEQSKRNEEWIRDTLSGGCEFNSTELYLKHINQVIQKMYN